ncbi:unnamed protein product [Linum trigynum]|uniref:Uncharacterized protein n=1 Tax=Linum trigynum TaxID=586398 RepID=A0AAV2CG53_9ROSI
MAFAVRFTFPHADLVTDAPVFTGLSFSTPGVEHVGHMLKRVAVGRFFHRGVDDIRMLRDVLVFAGVPRLHLLIVRVNCRRSHEVGPPFIGLRLLPNWLMQLASPVSAMDGSAILICSN